MDTSKTHEEIALEVLHNLKCVCCDDSSELIAEALRTAQSSLATAIMAVLPERLTDMDLLKGGKEEAVEYGQVSGFNKARFAVLSLLKSRGLV